jgi:uncharacterized membrane protein
MLVLTAFFVAVLVLLVAVVVDASAAFLARRRLAGTADGAALAAAQAVDLTAFYGGSGGDLLPLGDVEAAVAAYVTEPGTEVVGVEVVDGTTVVVTLRRHLALPLAPPGYGNGVDVTAQARARLPLRVLVP